MLIAMLIGITVPARLRHRSWRKEAAIRAQGYASSAPCYEYRLKYKTYPADSERLCSDRIPDPDGSLAAALAISIPMLTAQRRRGGKRS